MSRVPPPVSRRAADLLFEIGTEELPAAYLPGLIEQLKRDAEGLFQAQHLSYKRLQSFGAPRRLVLLVHELAGMQRRPAEEIRGPSKDIAYDGAGKPTQALLGFLRSRDGSMSRTKIVATEKGDYVYLVKPPSVVPTEKVLPALLPQLLAGLRAPKTMRWDDSGVRFARPIRWLLVLYGSKPIRCSAGRLTSSPRTWVGPPTRSKPIAVASVERYVRALAAHGLLLNQDERRTWIERTVARLAAHSRGAPAPEMASHGLLEEVTFLVEQPVELAGEFDRAYLELPREVLLASMAKYQRVFAMEARNRLLPRFVAILDGTPKRPAEVRRIFERILNARLADSLLFWKDDHAHLPLERMAAGLTGVAFHEHLGSVAEKTLRLRGLSEPLAEAWALTDEERTHLRRACQLAKADLVSTMVREFPTLQGVIGTYYARDSGEPDAVAEALGEQYLPAGEQRPKTLIGSALAILDKYETLTGYFGLGIEPTGDQDPFGLRRAAQGIVEVAWVVHRPLPLEPLLRARGSMAPFRSAQPREIAAVGQRIRRYLFERLYTFEWPARPGDSEGRAGEPVPSTDCIDAVLSSPSDDLIDAMDRIVSLQRLNGHASLLRAAKVIERTRNILRGAPLRQPQVDPARLQEPLERRLWDLYAAHQDEIAHMIQARSYAEATTRFGDLFFEPLHEFFEHVLVNVPEEALQQNRLALMKAINALYTERIADLSKLTILQREATS